MFFLLECQEPPNSSRRTLRGGSISAFAKRGIGIVTAEPCTLALREVERLPTD